MEINIRGLIVKNAFKALKLYARFKNFEHMLKNSKEQFYN